MKQAEVPLGERPGLQVLVEEREDVRLEGAVGHERRAGAGRDVLHQVLVVVPGVIDVDAELPWVADRRPPRLGYHDVDVVEAQALHGGEDGVHLPVQHVGIDQPRVLVLHAGVRPEQGVVERVDGESEEWVRVHHERGAGGSQEAQQRPHHLGDTPFPELSGGRGVGGGEDAEGLRGSDLDAVLQRQTGEDGVQVLHGRHEAGDQWPVGRGDHLVADEYAGDVGVVDTRDDVGSHPFVGESEVGEVGDEVVRHGDVDGEVGVGEGLHGGGVGVEEFDAVEGGAVGEELRDLDGWGEIACGSAVADSNAGSINSWINEQSRYHKGADTYHRQVQKDGEVPLIVQTMRRMERVEMAAAMVSSATSCTKDKNRQEDSGEGTSSWRHCRWILCFGQGGFLAIKSCASRSQLWSF